MNDWYNVPKHKRMKVLMLNANSGELVDKAVSAAIRKHFDGIKTAIMPMKGVMCYVCVKRKAQHRHHIVPVCRGGANTLDNLVPLCLRCHGRLDFNKMPPMKRDWTDFKPRYPKHRPLPNIPRKEQKGLRKGSLSSFSEVTFVTKTTEIIT